MTATTPPAPVDDLVRVVDAFERLLRGVRADQWDLSTPCTDWVVRTLVNHVVTGNLLFETWVRGTPPPDRSVDHLGDDPVAAFRTGADTMVEAFSQPGVLERLHPSPLGEQPGAFLVQMRITEHLVHGWDLARATAQPPGFPDELVDKALVVARRGLSNRPRTPGSFDEAQPAPEGAPVLDRLAAFLGRPL